MEGPEPYSCWPLCKTETWSEILISTDSCKVAGWQSGENRNRVTNSQVRAGASEENPRPLQRHDVKLPARRSFPRRFSIPRASRRCDPFRAGQATPETATLR